MNSRQGCLFLMGALVSLLTISGCASNRKQKFDQREKAALASGLYCDFVNGEKSPEVELELNLLMSKKCDADKNFSITSYRTPAEVSGILYCCSTKKIEVKPPEAKVSPSVSPSSTPAPSSSTIAPAVPPKGQTPVDKKPAQPQDKLKDDKDEEIVPL